DNGFVRITRVGGNVLYVSDWPKDRSFDPAKVPMPQPSNEKRFERTETVSNGGRLLITSFRVDTQDGSQLLMEIGSADRHIRETLWRLSLIFAISFPLVIATGIAIGYLLTRRALKPINEITTKAEVITSRNLSDRLPVAATGDEVEHLGLALN